MSVALESAVQFVPICRVDEVPLGLGRAYRVGEHRIALFRSRAGRVYAVANRCPHKNAPLADGMLIGEQIVCPFHAFRFDAKSGACDQETVCAVATYPIELIDDTVHIGIPAGERGA